MLVKWDTAFLQRRRRLCHQQTAQLSGTPACMSKRVEKIFEELENVSLGRTDVCRVMLEEARQTADEGSLVCLGPKNVAAIHYRIL